MMDELGPAVSFLAWILPALLIPFALLRLPYDFYISLRWLVFLASGVLAWRMNQSRDIVRALAWIFVGLALLYNPIFPLHNDRSLWTAINVLTEGVFIIGFFIYSLPMVAINFGEPSQSTHMGVVRLVAAYALFTICTATFFIPVYFLITKFYYHGLLPNIGRATFPYIVTLLFKEFVVSLILYLVATSAFKRVTHGFMSARMRLGLVVAGGALCLLLSMIVYIFGNIDIIPRNEAALSKYYLYGFFVYLLCCEKVSFVGPSEYAPTSPPTRPLSPDALSLPPTCVPDDDDEWDGIPRP